MDESERGQIERLLSHNFDLAKRGLAEDIGAILAKNAATGLLRSGATVRQVCQAIDLRYLALIPELAGAIGQVSQSREAFLLLRQAFDDAAPHLESEVTRIATLVSSRGSDGQPHRSILNAGLDLFNQHRADLAAKLDIDEFAFLRTAAVQSAPAAVQSEVVAPINRGGKPLAAHWDGMWADIAFQLYIGDLKPKRQKDISAAMFAWFNEAEINVGQTAVTERARALWLKIEPLL